MRGTRCGMRGAVGLATLLWAVACGAALAAEDLSAPAETTPEAIQQRIDQVQSAGDLEQSVRDKALSEYRQALASAREAQEQTARAAQLAGERREAPQQVADIRQKLAEPPAEPQAKAPGASLADLEQGLAQAQDDVAAARKALGDLETQQRERPSRPDVLALESKARDQLAAVDAELAAPAGARPLVEAAAHATALRAKKAALEAEINRCEEEALGYGARGELLRARHDLAARELEEARATAARWRQSVLEKQQQDALAAAKAAAGQVASVPPQLRPAAERNEQIALALAGNLTGNIEQAAADLADMQARRDALQSDLADVKARVGKSGLTKAMGVFLRKRQAELPNLASLRVRQQTARGQMADAQAAQLEYIEERDALANLDDAVREALARLAPGVGAAERQKLAPDLRKLLAARQDLLADLIDRYDAYLNALGSLAQVRSGLVEVVRDYREFVDTNILWFRSSAPLAPDDLPHVAQAVRWCVAPANWLAVLRALAADVRAVPLYYALALLVVAAMLGFGGRFRAELHRLAGLVADIETDRIRHTLRAMVLTLLLAAPWPLLAGFAGWRLGVAADATAAARAVGAGLWALAIALLSIDLPRRICAEDGLALQHFRWRSRPSQVARRNLTWLLPLALPGAFLVAAFRAQPEAAWSESAGRLGMALLLVVMAVFSARVLRFRGGILQEALARRPDGWLYRMRYLCYLAAVGAPLALAAAAAFGFYYTAVVLGVRLVWTAWLLLALMLVYELLMRLLFVLRRRLAREQMRKRRAAEQAQRAEKEPGETPPVAVEEPEVSIYSISAQTQQLVRSGVWFSVVIVLYLVWGDVLPALGKLGGLSLAPVLPVTLGAVGLALLTVLVTVIAVKNLPGLLEIALLQHLPLEQAVRFAITTVCRYAIVLVGLVMAANALGARWEKVQWLAAAVTVGLGFGLQEIFANFVSGLIILFERPMRVGDTVTVGDTTGTVSRIRIRATTIVDWDRKELVVPNKEFITGRLINWTLSDRILRMVIPVGIAYGSDTELARSKLLEVAKANQAVLDEPEPVVYFMGFGDSSLSFELRVYVSSVEAFQRTRHEVHMAIDKAFREAGVEIAFPQRDVHIRSIDAALPLEDRRPRGQ